MYTCGSYDYLFNRSLPAPDVVVDNSSYNELPMEERLAITQKDLQQLKETLRLKDSEHEDIQHELKFHSIKNEELMDVINAFRSSSSDRSHEIMRAKAEQNSELTVQVHSLRDILTKSGEEIAALQKEIKQKNKKGRELEVYKRDHERLKVQLKGLMKTLMNVEISTVDIPSEWINLQWITGGFGGNKKAEEEDSDKSIQNITQKIIAMEADRQRLLKDSKLYNQSDGDKEDKILALERQVRKMQHDKDELHETNNSMKQQLKVREGKIGALEELFQNINANRSIEAAKGKGETPNRRDSLLNVEDEYEDDCESVDIDSLAPQNVTQTFEEIFTSIWENFAGKPVAKKDVGDDISTNDEDDEEISSCFNASYHTNQVDEEIKNAAKAENEELKEIHQALTENYEAAQFKISDLSAKLEEYKIKANSFKTKAELREKLMKDVIQQYKELQLENSASNERMIELKQKVAQLLQLEKERHAELKAKETSVTASAAGGKIVIQGPSVTSLGEAPTFDMSERTRETSDVDSRSENDAEASSSGLDKNYLSEDHKRLEEECDRLQTEFDSAIEKITDLEESLQEARDEITKSQTNQADQARTIALLEGEKTTLQDRLVEATTKYYDTQSTHTRAEDELRLSELRENKAREKQMEREKDLWDVIEQYKKLADEKQSTQEQMQEVEHELELTQKVKIQRRHLVYEYRKLEKAMEEAVETGEELAKQLQMARSEAAVNKEETKGVRKRLVGCHFHYKELQEQYDAVLKQSDDQERRLAKAQKHEALHNSQAESWAAMMENVRGKRRAAEEKMDSLTKEKEELQQLCYQLKEENKYLPAEA